MTASATACLLMTSDPKMIQHLALVAGGLTDMHAVANRSELARAQERAAPALVLLDLRHPDADAVLAESAPDVRAGMIVFGVPESDPFIGCRDAGLFAVEPLDAAPHHVRQTLRQALMLHRIQEELALLRQHRAAGAEASPAADEPALNSASLYELGRASRHYQNTQKLLEQLIEGVAAAGRIARVGAFVRLRDETTYRLGAGLRCLDDTGLMTFEPDDPFVRWLERHAHLVCRTRLPHIADPHERRLLQRALDGVGAEIIVPLLGQRGLLGWLFVGHRATGLPFAGRDLSELSVIGEQVTALFENALLVEELAVQKTLAENLLETIPVGILAVSEDGIVRWFNRAAELILGVTAAETVNRPVEQAGSRVADVMLRAMRDGADPAPTSWTDPANRRTIQAAVHRVSAGGTRLGAMLLVSDISRERLLREKQEELERHAFWNDLAAAMSHEVRNPLVAISTFAQLLPERYNDDEFRRQFFDIVTGEVNRLNTIITQINVFAHPPKPVFRLTAPGEIAKQACARAAHLIAPGKLSVTRAGDDSLPLFLADADALSNGIAQVLINAHEAVKNHPSPHIALHVRCSGVDGVRALVFAVTDNGPGIPDEMRDKLFSPFSTTKPRGLGLGLPLARRTVVDHGGRIDVDTTPQGTTVTVTLPLEGRPSHAETVNCG
jgi:PAS domain S-box-containing protein